MKNFIFYLIAVIISLGNNTNGYGQSEGGLAFRSYDSKLEDRTSLVIPSSPSKWKLGDYMSISFDVRAKQKIDNFGYVARIVIGDQTSIDLMLNNPVNKDPFMCIIKDRKLISKVHRSNPIDLREWSRVNIELSVHKNRLTITENGELIADSLELPQGRKIQLFFGANYHQGFTTTDVAPIVIKELAIKFAPNKDAYLWPFIYPENAALVYDKTGRAEAQLSNPDWMINNHIHWRKVRSVVSDSKIFSVIDNSRGEIILVDKNSVCRFDASADTLIRYEFSPNLRVDRLCDQFIYDHYNGKLLMYDFDQSIDNIVSEFDFQRKTWSLPVLRNRLPTNLHHSKYLSPIDSSIVQLFGYGFHQYRRDQLALCRRVTQIKSAELEEISPRYLSAIGVIDSSLYVYGGAGNEIGMQEYGTQLYNDLFRVDLRSGKVECLWKNSKGVLTEIAASSLVIDEDRANAKALFFTPLRSESYLVLKNLDLKSGETTMLADTIPYTFKDIESDADLTFNPATKSYYAVVVYLIRDGVYQADIYEIYSPVLVHPEFAYAPQDSMLLWLFALLIGVVGVGALVYVKRRNRTGRLALRDVNLGASAYDDISVVINATDVTRTPGIYLLNGFQVIDRQGSDITGEFTPIMRQLLSLIILYSHPSGKGVSNTKLKEFLWYDKSEESSRNNRSVHISKMRVLLDGVGNYEISSANSYWLLQLHENAYCDYVYAMTALEIIENKQNVDAPQIALLLKIASWGELLPNMQFDWLDGFKASYSDMLIPILGKIRDAKVVEADWAAIIKLSDAILKFDSLDEVSVQRKCAALISTKRNGAAKSTFEQFAKEYEQMMGQSYEGRFEGFMD